MNIEIKISKKPVEYMKAISFIEERINMVQAKKASELIWLLEHPSIYTGGIRSKKNEILDNSLKVIKTNRGGKITWHGPGQIICYFGIDLNKRNKDIRKFILNLEKILIKTLEEYKIKFMINNKKFTYKALLPEYFKKILKIKRLNYSNS